MYGMHFDSIDFADIPKNNTFCIDYVGNMAYLYCDSAKEAVEIQNRLQSLDGTKIERDGSFLYCVVENMESAIKDLSAEGFDCEEVA